MNESNKPYIRIYREEKRLTNLMILWTQHAREGENIMYGWYLGYIDR